MSAQSMLSPSTAPTSQPTVFNFDDSTFNATNQSEDVFLSARQTPDVRSPDSASSYHTAPLLEGDDGRVRGRSEWVTFQRRPEGWTTPRSSRIPTARSYSRPAPMDTVQESPLTLASEGSALRTRRLASTSSRSSQTSLRRRLDQSTYSNVSETGRQSSPASAVGLPFDHTYEVLGGGEVDSSRTLDSSAMESTRTEPSQDFSSITITEEGHTDTSGLASADQSNPNETGSANNSNNSIANPTYLSPTTDRDRERTRRWMREWNLEITPVTSVRGSNTSGIGSSTSSRNNTIDGVTPSIPRVAQRARLSVPLPPFGSRTGPVIRGPPGFTPAPRPITRENSIRPSSGDQGRLAIPYVSPTDASSENTGTVRRNTRIRFADDKSKNGKNKDASSQ